MSSAIKGAMGFTRFFHPIYHTSLRSSKTLNERACWWSSSYIVQSSPSQLPGAGELGWSRFIAHAEQDKAQRPISPVELRQGKRILELEQRIAEMEKIFAKIKNVVEGIPDPKIPFQKSGTQ